MFKGAHVGELPTQQASNLQILAGLQSQLENEQEALNTAQQQQVYLQTLINQYRTLQGTSKTARYSDGFAGDRQGTRQAKVATGRSQFSVHRQYPDVRKLKAQIAKTEKMRDSSLLT